MNVTFIQTADPVFYYPMLQQTSRTVRTFCIENGFSYESYVGIKRGVVPWNAAYNRVYMLKEMVDRGLMGWVFYMDADAYIYDMSFDVRNYLSDKHHFAGIFAGYINGQIAHSINSGGFAINLGHAAGRQLALDYWAAVNAIPEKDYKRAVVWGKDIDEDQLILFRLLADYCETRMLGHCFLFERSNQGYTNNGPFIRQALRSTSADFRSRMQLIRNEVDVAMRGHVEADGEEQPGYYLTADHPMLRVAVGVRTAGEIRTTQRAGCLTFGPHIALGAGRYLVKIIGQARAAADGHPITLESDIATDEGRTIWTKVSQTLQPSKGVLLAYELVLPEAVTRLEVRTYVDAHQDLSLFAIQIQWTDEWVREC